MPFHHREPGILGAALGRPGVHVEVIPDGVHVSPTLVDWVRRLHPAGTCFVSDCVTAAGTEEFSDRASRKSRSRKAPGTEYDFGSLRVHLAKGACRLPDGELAGGGVLLPESYGRWVGQQTALLIAGDLKSPREQLSEKLLKDTLPHVTRIPLQAIGVDPRTVRGLRVEWRLDRRTGLPVCRPV